MIYTRFISRNLQQSDYYLIGSSAVCGVTKTLEVWDAKVDMIYPAKERDLLMGEK